MGRPAETGGPNKEKTREDMTMPEPIITALIAAIVSIIGTFTGMMVSARRNRAEAMKLCSDAHATDIETMRGVISTLESEVKRLTEGLSKEQAKRREVERRVEELFQELMATKAENLSLQRENESLARRVRELERERAELRREVEKLREEIGRIGSRQEEDDGLHRPDDGQGSDRFN